MDTLKTEDIPTSEENSLTVEEKDGAKPEAKGKASEILEGKREKKVVQRLNMQISTTKEKLKIESTGQGVKLGDIARINHSIGKLKAPLLKPLHKIVYDRPGAASSLRKNLRLFNGFPFEVDSEPYKKKLSKMARLQKAQLKTICQTLDLERSGKQSVLVERIMMFLLSPTDSGKPVIIKKKKKDVKREKSSSKSKKPQKKMEGGKSRAIVTDSSSDDEDDEDQEKKNKSTEKPTAVSQKRKTSESQSSDKEEDDDDEDEEDAEEEPEAPEEESEEEEKSPRKKKSPAKKVTKKSEQKSEESSDDSDRCSQEEKTPKKTTKKPAVRRKAPAKPVPKTKKADSSSNRGKKTANKRKDESESSDDDQPLIKMIKKPPTDDQLKTTIQDLLKDANLEEVTMKQLCRQVYDKYPDFDLTSRKDYIKDTVKTLIS